jgi:tetratricopeptide (TPR) repeat protein
MFSPQALQTAAGTLQRISESTPGERGWRASVVALALRAVELSMAGDPGSEFLRRRVEGEIDRFPSGSERAALHRLMIWSEDPTRPVVIDLLSVYAEGLEEARRLPEAEAVIELARSLAADRADLALRAARLARLQHNSARALELYRAAAELDHSRGAVSRLAAVGEAVVAADPERALSAAVRRAVHAGDQEAAAAGLEERGRVRRARGDRSGAARDLGSAAARFSDAVDRGRVAHQLADLFVAAGDPEAAREALLFALSSGDRSQVEHAQARLHTICRDLGDQLGMRRWRSFSRPSMVSLSSRPTARTAVSAAPRMSRWRERVEQQVARKA